MTEVRYSSGEDKGRLQEVERIEESGISWSSRLGDLARAARELSGASMAAVTLVREDDQVFLARSNLDLESTPREHSFCAHAIAEADDVFVVRDAREDPRFAGNPYVEGEPGIRFYAGVPVLGPEGRPVGTLCVLDPSPMELDSSTRDGLSALGDHVTRQLSERPAPVSSAEDVAAFLAHELRAPLSGLVGTLDLLDASIGLDLGSEIQGTLDSARREADRLAEIVDALTRFARADASVETATVELNAVLDDVASHLLDRHPGARIEAEPLPAVRANRVLLEILFENLVANGIKHGGEEPTVRVEVEGTDTGWCVTVEDDGAGNPEADREEMITLYRRPGSKADGPGSGIGLALCRLIVRRHGGEIWIDGDADGGAQVSFTLPARPDEPLA